MKGEFQPDSAERKELPPVADLAGRVVRAVEEALHLPHSAPRDDGLLREVEGLDTLLEEIGVLREFSLALSRGELGYKTRQGGMITGALKALQANLRHLTWQAQRIAAGDLDVRVNFLGQFSEAFNCMAERLKETLDEKENIAARYKDLSAHDPLTGLYNRAAFQELMARLLSSEAYREKMSALIISDIDYFKNINDSFGHQCGDEVLRRVSGLYRDSLRADDVVCRYGGEEFLILTPGISRNVACRIAQRLCDSVRAMQIIWEDSVVPVTASFGVCSLPPVGEEGFGPRFLREHIQIADLNLYRAKHAGRDRVVSGDCDDADAGAGCGRQEN